MTAGAGGITGLGTITTGAVTGTLTINSFGAVAQNAGDKITGATSLVKQGAGAMTLSQTNDYTGATNVNAGVLNVQNAQGTGTTAGGVVVADGAALELQGGIAVGAEALTLNGTLQGTGAGASLAGAVALGAGTRAQHRGCR